MLNLIPKEQKEELRLEKILDRVRKICLSIVLATVALAMLLVANYYILDQAVAKTQENILVSSINLSGIENLKQDIINFNSDLAKVIQIQSSHVNPLEVLDEFQQLVPGNVVLTYLDLDLEKKIISIQGVSKDRDSLLEFQNNLNSSTVFINFDYPLGSLTEKESIDFLFQGEIDLAKL